MWLAQADLSGAGNLLLGVAALLGLFVGGQQALRSRLHRKRSNGKLTEQQRLLDGYKRLADQWEQDTMDCRQQIREMQQTLSAFMGLEARYENLKVEVDELRTKRRRRGAPSPDTSSSSSPS